MKLDSLRYGILYYELQVDLVFVIDASASVGEANFRGELNFVRKLLSDLTMAPRATRVAIVTFASKEQIIRQVDYVSLTRQRNLADDKCRLLNIQLDAIGYSGGGTYTHGALMEAFVSVIARLPSLKYMFKAILACAIPISVMPFSFAATHAFRVYVVTSFTIIRTLFFYFSL